MTDMVQNGNGPPPAAFPDGTLKVDEAHVTNALLEAVLQSAQAGASAQDTREMGEAAKAALAFAQAVVILDPGVTSAGEPLDHQIALADAQAAGAVALEHVRGQHALAVAKERAAAPTPSKGKSVSVRRDQHGRAASYEVSNG